jgi:hypothetical protein
LSLPLNANLQYFNGNSLLQYYVNYSHIVIS